jgi:hypothetical protein
MAKTGITRAAFAQLLGRNSRRNPTLGCFGNAATGAVPDLARRGLAHRGAGCAQVIKLRRCTPAAPAHHRLQAFQPQPADAQQVTQALGCGLGNGDKSSVANRDDHLVTEVLFCSPKTFIVLKRFTRFCLGTNPNAARGINQVQTKRSIEWWPIEDLLLQTSKLRESP